MKIYCVSQNTSFQSKLAANPIMQSLKEFAQKADEAQRKNLSSGLSDSGIKAAQQSSDVFVKTLTELEKEVQILLENHPVRDKILNIFRASNEEQKKCQLEFLKLIKDVKMSDDDYNYLLRLLQRDFPIEPLIAEVWGLCLQKGLDIYTLMDRSYSIDKKCAENIIEKNLLEKYKNSPNQALLMSRFNSDETGKRVSEYANNYGKSSVVSIISQFPAGDDDLTNSALDLIYRFKKLFDKSNSIYELEAITKWKSTPLTIEDIDSKNKILDIIEKCSDINSYWYYIPALLHKTDSQNEKIVAGVLQKGTSLQITDKIVSMINNKNEEFIISLFMDKSQDILTNKVPALIETFNFFNQNLSKIEKLELSDKIQILNRLKSVPDEMKPIYAKFGYDIDYYINELNMQLGEKVSVVRVPVQNQRDFVSMFLSNKDLLADNILKTYDFDQYGKVGIPLKYSRKKFCKNINSILSNLKENEQNILLKHFGLTRGENYSDGTVSFDGILNNTKFEKNNASDELREAAKCIEEEIEKFTLKNETLIKNEKLKKILDSVVKGIPEFTAIVGKEQNNKHANSVDIQTLKVLQSVMNNPMYSTLSDKGKTVLKMSILLHDIGNPISKSDTNYPNASARYADGMLEKFNLPADIKNRITDIIRNYNWFEGYNKGTLSVEDVVVCCRRPEDFEIYKIIAKADLENVNPTLHFDVKPGGTKTQVEIDNYLEEKLEPVNRALNQVYSSHNPVFYTRFIGNGKLFPIKKVKINNEDVELRVLDLNELPDNASLEQYGFPKGTTKENVRFLVHMTRPNISNIESVIYLTKNRLKDSTWSTSVIKHSNNITYENLQYGFVFNAEQANFADAYFENIATGNNKTLESFRDILFGKVLRYDLNKLNVDLTQEERKELCNIVLEKGYLPKINEKIVIGGKTITPEQVCEVFCGSSNLYLRDIMLDNLKKEGFELNDDEYADLMRYLMTKKYLTQITQPNLKGELTGQSIKAGKHSIPAKTLVNCLNITLDRLFDGGHVQSEVIVLNPLPAAFIAKVDNVENCHPAFLEMAKKYKDMIPVIIMKDSEKT